MKITIKVRSKQQPGEGVSIRDTEGNTRVSADMDAILAALTDRIYDLAYAASIDAAAGGAFDTYIAAAAPVQSVAGRTGDVVLDSTDISDFFAAAADAAPVQSVAGSTGDVTLDSGDLTDVTPTTVDTCDAGTIDVLTV